MCQARMRFFVPDLSMIHLFTIVASSYVSWYRCVDSYSRFLSRMGERREGSLCFRPLDSGRWGSRWMFQD